jgi:outer membrane receptor protein involved in Fe transport
VGQVLERDLGDGMPGVTVGVDGTDIVVVTDAAGRFSMHDVPRGPIVLVASATDYQTVRLRLTEAQRAQPVVLSLTIDEALQLTVVSASTRPETASTTFLSSRDLDAAPRRNAEELLRQVPGLTLVQHGSEGKGYQFFLRGFDAVHGTDLELSADGLPINEWSNVHAQGYLDLSMVIPELVRGVVVTKGPFTLDQGAFGMAGSVDFRLGTPLDQVGWRAAYTVGTTNRHRVFAGWSPEGGNGQQFVGFEFTHDDGYGDQRRLQRGTFNARMRLFDSDRAGRMHLLALGGHARFELPGPLRQDDVDAGRVDLYGAYDPDAEGASSRGVAALQWDLSRGDHDWNATAWAGYRSLDLLENFTGFLLDPVEGDRRGQAQRTTSFGVRARHETRFGERWALGSGVGLRGDVFQQDEDQVGRDLDDRSPRRDLQGTQLLPHALLGVRWSPVDAVRVDAGARLDVVHVQVTDDLDGSTRGGGTLVTVSPRLTARWRATPDASLFAAYGRGLRPPEARAFTSFDPGQAGLSDDVYDGGEPATTVSDAVELGARWQPAWWLDLSVAGFATFIERESLFDHVSGVSLDLDGTRRLGGELVVTMRPAPWLVLSADVTAVDARFVTSGNRVPLAPWLVAGARATVTHDSGVLGGLRVVTVAPRPLPHGARGATLVRGDATLGWRWRWLQLGVEVENLFAQRLREGEYHYASHWNLGGPRSELPTLHVSPGTPPQGRLTVGMRL